MDADADLVWEILILRAYARAKLALDHAPDQAERDRLLTQPIVQLVKETEFSIAEEDMAGARQDD